MCGIAGECNLNEDYLASLEKQHQQLKILTDMRESIAHRGKDQTGEYLRSQVGLSHTRLSIRDIKNGKQPMTCTSDGHEYTIVYNGEIYNTKELTSTLKKAGYTFQTTSDTEVILKAYLHYGTDCVQHLNGIFAFAIWDSYKQCLFLVRDHVGVKPLFYTIQNETLIFGSELKALFAHPFVKPVVNLSSFQEVLGIGPARTPGCGIFEEINEVIPGTFLLYQNGTLHSEKYWDITSHEHTDSYTDTVDHVSELLRDSITRQMISDVPVCSFLSGGVDSSIITAIAANFLHNKGTTLNTYSFDFSGNKQYFKSNSFQPEQDRPYVEKMLSHVPVHHTYLFCHETELIPLLTDSLMAKDLPGMADVDSSLLYFCQLVKKQNKVALTGECADEIFGGYPWFYRSDLLQGPGFPWSKHVSVRESFLSDSMIRKLHLEEYSLYRYEESRKQVPVLPGESPLEAKRRENAYLNIKWFMQTLLDRMDRASMYTGLEARVPFADHRIIDYVFNVPWEMKCKNGIEKALLRDAFQDVLPAELLYRKKSPYPKTYHPGYERLLQEKLFAIINNSNDPIHAFIDKDKVERSFSEDSDYGKPWFGQLMAAPQLIAYFIQISEWLNLYKPEIHI